MAEFGSEPKAGMDQHFLCNADKIRTLVDAAAIAPGDAVVELGAGVGSVARHFPPCASLTLVDLDAELAQQLRALQLPGARVLEADALQVLRDGAYDVVISNLPFNLTEGVLEILAAKAANRGFRRAVLSVHNDDAFGHRPYHAALHFRPLCLLQREDFSPVQPFLSRLVLVTPREGVTSTDEVT